MSVVTPPVKPLTAILIGPGLLGIGVAAAALLGG